MNQSLTTHLSPLSPLLTYGPCISCDWTQGWKQGWNNSGPWDGSSQRWAEGWSTASNLTMDFSFQGSAVSLLVGPTSYYRLNILLNGTLAKTLDDLQTSNGKLELGNLPLGTHALHAVFQSKEANRAPSQDGVARVLGLDVVWNGSSVNSSVLDDSAWTTRTIGYSAGWNFMSIVDPSANVINSTEATILTPSLSSSQNSSLSWTGYNGSSLSFDFSGNYLTVLAPLTASLPLGSFVPLIDSVSYPTVNLSRNLAPATEDSSTVSREVVWHQAGLGDGPHSVTLRNVGSSILIIDAFNFGTVEQQPISVPSSTSSSVSSASSSSTPTTIDVGSGASSLFQNGSSSVGIIIAIAVGAAGLLGLLLLLVYKRFRPSRSTPNRRSGIGGLAIKRFSNHPNHASTLFSPSAGSTRSFAPLINLQSSASAIALNSSTSTSSSNLALTPATIWASRNHAHPQQPSMLHPISTSVSTSSLSPSVVGSNPINNDARQLGAAGSSNSFEPLFGDGGPPRRPEMDSRQSSVTFGLPRTVVPEPRRLVSQAGEIGDMLIVAGRPASSEAGEVGIMSGSSEGHGKGHGEEDEEREMEGRRATFQTTGTGSVYSLGDSYYTLDDELHRRSGQQHSMDFQSMNNGENASELDSRSRTPPGHSSMETMMNDSGADGAGEAVEMRRRNGGGENGTPDFSRLHPSGNYF